jgi:hypothetical protein
MLGMICSVPFFIFGALKKKQKKQPKVSEPSPGLPTQKWSSEDKSEPYGID